MLPFGGTHFKEMINILAVTCQTKNTEMKSYLRFLGRNNLYTAIEVVVLSLALAFVIVLSSYIVNDMNINRILKNTDDIYLVHSLDNSSIYDEVPGSYGRIPQIESSCSFVQSGRTTSLFDDLTTASHGDRKMNVSILGVSDTFFDLFTFPLTEGDPESVLGTRNSVVISEEMANELFPDGDALGKKINVFERNYMGMYGSDEPQEDFNVDLTVTGIFKPFSRTVFIEPDMIMSYDLIIEKQEAMYHGGMRIGEYSFIKVAEGTDIDILTETLTKEFDNAPHKYRGASSNLQLQLTQFDDIKKMDPDKSVYAFDNIRQGRLFGIYLMMCIFIAIVSLLDYIVLTIAFSRFRIKEIATRQLLGTDRKGIIRRCFVEAFVLLAISCVFAILIAVAFRNPIGQILGAEINPLGQLSEYLILAGIVLIMVALASAVPSFILSSYSAINVIKGEARYKDKLIFGKIFIGLAGLLSIGALSVCFGVVRQTRHFINQPFGYEFDNIVCVEFASDENRFYDEMKSQTYVDKIGAYGSLPTQWTMTGLRNNTTGNYDRIGFIDGNSDFFDILGIDIIEDNTAVSANTQDGKWYVCESAYEGLSEYMTDGMLNFYNADPLGGIVKDIKIGNVKEEAYSNTPFINVIDIPDMIEYGSLAFKVNIDENKAKSMIYDFYRSKGYDDNMYFVYTLREEVERELKEEMNMLKLLTGFSLICLLMTIMTVVGLSSYHSKTTEKDNAVRNVFGCSKKELVKKITFDFVLPVLISAVAAIPVAYMVISRWLEGYVLRTDNSPVIYIGAFAVVLTIVVAAILIQAFRMTRTNPAEALKKE